MTHSHIPPHHFFSFRERRYWGSRKLNIYMCEVWWCVNLILTTVGIKNFHTAKKRSGVLVPLSVLLFSVWLGL